MSERTVIYILIACVLGLGAALIAKPAAPVAEPLPVRAESLRVEPDPAPSHNSAALKREADGHYWARSDVDGVSIKFLVDTGASVVALTWRDAQRLRLKPEERDFKWSIRTANGETFAASVLLPYVRVGSVEIENVEAMIMQDGLLDNSLLGISFLEELYSYEFKGDTMIIKK